MVDATGVAIVSTGRDVIAYAVGVPLTVNLAHAQAWTMRITTCTTA